jgi:hypothetical protein
MIASYHTLFGPGTVYATGRGRASSDEWDEIEIGKVVGVRNNGGRDDTTKSAFRGVAAGALIGVVLVVVFGLEPYYIVPGAGVNAALGYGVPNRGRGGGGG